MKRFLYLVAALASFTLAVSATAALAADHPDNRPNHGPGAVALAGLVRPDDRATHGPGGVAVEQMAQLGAVASASPGSGADGFDWLAAGIGVAAGLGIALIAGGGLTIALRNQRHPSFS